MKGLRFQNSALRFVLSILAVALGVAAISGAFIIRSSVTSTVGHVVDAVVGADAYVIPKGTSVSDVVTKPNAEQKYLESSTNASVRSSEDVKAALPVYLGPLVLADANGKVFSSKSAPTIGITADPNQVEQGRLVEGTLPTSPREVALEQNTATATGLKVGDNVTLIVNGATLDSVAVVGIVSYDSGLGGAYVVILNGIVARAFYSSSGMIPFLAVQAMDGVTPEQLQSSVTQTLGSGTNAEVVLGGQARQDAINQVNQSLNMYFALLFILGIFGLVVGGYLTVNTVATGQRNGYKEIAAAKALGASTNAVLTPILTQAVITGVIGSIVGIIGGFIIGSIARGIIANQGIELSSGVPWVWLLVCLVLGVLLAVISAWLGARKAASVSVSEAIGSQADPSPARGLSRFGIVRLVVGVLLLLIGVIILVIGWGSTGTLRYVVAGTIAVIVAVALLAPVLVLALTQVFVWPLYLFSALSAKLAKSNIARSPRRAGNVAGVFIVFLALATSVVILASSTAASAQATTDKAVTDDFIVQPTDATGVIPDPVVAQIRQLANVKVSAFGLAPIVMLKPDASAPDDPSKASQVDPKVYFGPSDIFSGSAAQAIVAGDAGGFDGGLALSQSFANAQGLKVGDQVNLIIAPNTPYQVQTTTPLTVAVILNTSIYADMMVSTTWLVNQLDGHTRAQFMPVTLLFVQATDPSATEAVQTSLTDTVDSYHTITVQTRDGFVASADPRINQARLAGYILGGVGVVLAILVLFNTLGLSVAERRKELGLLKSFGLTRGQLGNMIGFESVLVSASGALAGIVIGVCLAFAAGKGLSSRLGLTTWTIPWIWLVVLFVVSIIVGILATIAPSLRAGRTPLPRAVGV